MIRQVVHIKLSKYYYCADTTVSLMLEFYFQLIRTVMVPLC